MKIPFYGPGPERHTWERLFRCTGPQEPLNRSTIMVRKKLGSSLSQLWVFAGPHKKLIASMLLLSLVAQGMIVSIPLAVGFVFDKVLSQGRLDLLNLFGPLMLVFITVLTAVQYADRRLASILGILIIRDMRLRIHKHLLAQTIRYLEDFQVGRLVARILNDTEAVRSMLHSVLMQVVSNGLRLALVVSSMLWMDWRLTLLSCGFLPFFAYRMQKLIKRLKPASKELAEDQAKLMAHTGEAFSGIRLIKVFGREQGAHLNFMRRIHLILRKRLAIRDTHYRIISIWEFASWMGLLLLIWYGGLRVIQGELSQGHLIAFYGLLGMLTTPISVLLKSLETVLMASASLERIHEVLLQKPEIADRPSAKVAGRLKGKVFFDRVRFRYPARQGETEHNLPDTLTDIQVSVQPGQTVAMVGPSGSGKSTLALLLARLYDVTDGSIQVDGVDIRDYSLVSYRRNLAAVLQESVLFDGTIRDNIAYARPDAQEGAIEEATRMAQAWDFINDFPEGLDTLVGERGATLSGGQRQRIAIARAFLANPSILILDEATSALDSQSEALVQEALKALLRNRTTFVIAHRLSTVVDSDLILAMESGRIVEQGRHEKLIQHEGLYARLYREQFGEILQAEGLAGPQAQMATAGIPKTEKIPFRDPMPVGPQLGDQAGGQELEIRLSEDILGNPKDPEWQKKSP